MELQDLMYFIRVSELKSISKTAAEYQVVPSAISNHIGSLEQELGYRLFDRNMNAMLINE